MWSPSRRPLRRSSWGGGRRESTKSPVGALDRLESEAPRPIHARYPCRNRHRIPVIVVVASVASETLWPFVPILIGGWVLAMLVIRSVVRSEERRVGKEV